MRKNPIGMKSHQANSTAGNKSAKNERLYFNIDFTVAVNFYRQC